MWWNFSFEPSEAFGGAISQSLLYTVRFGQIIFKYSSGTAHDSIKLREKKRDF
jgi:hypothetical protein